MRKNKLLTKFTIVTLILAVALLTLLTSCITYTPIKGLKEVEIRDYDGERLDSINHFRENSIKGPQYINVDSYKLEITGLVNNPKSYSYDEVLSHQPYSKVLTLYCVEGWEAKILWEGVLIKDLLEEAGIKQGTLTVIFHAHDGYTSSLPLDLVINNNILLAYKMNNVTLPPERGFPFQVVAEDKWGYKWVKWVTKIELSGDPNYKGFWESSGYNNDGSLSGPQFGN